MVDFHCWKKIEKKLYQKTNESVLMICPIFGKRIYAVIINKYVVLIMEQMISTVHFTKISKRFSLQEGKNQTNQCWMICTIFGNNNTVFIRK